MAKTKAKNVKISKKSVGEETLAHHLRSYQIRFEREWRFHPTRMWRFDFCIPEKMLAIECEGGVWLGAKGGHTSGKGMIRNMAKYNTASRMGWIILRFTPQQIKSGVAILEIKQFLERK